MILYAIRFVWIASHIAVLMRAQETGWRYRAWCAYIGLSLMLSAVYWPELLPGWEVVMAPYLVALLLLRTLACLEALHHQTSGFPQWPRMMGGAFLLGFVVCLLLAGVRDNRWAGLLIEYRRYLQIWTMTAMFAVQLMLTERHWRTRFDRHALLVFGLACNHGMVSWWCMAKHPESAMWLNLNLVSTGLDAALYAAWAFLAPPAFESVRSQLRRSARLQSASPEAPAYPLSRVR